MGVNQLHIPGHMQIRSSWIQNQIRAAMAMCGVSSDLVETILTNRRGLQAWVSLGHEEEPFPKEVIAAWHLLVFFFSRHFICHLGKRGRKIKRLAGLMIKSSLRPYWGLNAGAASRTVHSRREEMTQMWTAAVSRLLLELSTSSPASSFSATDAHFWKPPSELTFLSAFPLTKLMQQVLCLNQK